MLRKIILVTGAGGFVGRALGQSLKYHFPTFIIVGTSLNAVKNPLGYDTFNAMSLEDAAMPKFIKTIAPDFIIHLAAHSSVGQAVAGGLDVYSENVASTRRLLEMVKANAPQANLIFASSGEVYGASFNIKTPIDETITPEPLNPYAKSKLMGEHLCAEILSKPSLSLRLFNHIGAGQDERFVVASFAAQIARIEAGLQPPIIKVGNLEAIRDFIPLDDALTAYCHAIDYFLQQERTSHLVFNVSGGKGIKIADILSKLLALSKKKITIEQEPTRMRANDIPVAIGDASAFIKATKWHVYHSLDITLEHILNDWHHKIKTLSQQKI